LEALKEYHNKINEGSVNFSMEDEIIKFIDKIQSQIGDEKLNTLIDSLRFW
jgi:hypothetical protein